jgi:hypothetical protein
MSAASSGDTVTVPGGSCSWSSGVTINKAITLQGAGAASTNISGPAVWITAAGARLTGFKFTGGNVSVSGARFRIDNNTFVISSEVITVSGVYGLVDSNTFQFSGTNAEVVKIYGPNDSWATPSSFGTADAVYLEDNTFTTTQGLGSSQAVQGNYNARFVVRYNTITNAKIDAHGIWSNGDPRYYGVWTNPTEHSARHYEVYGNRFRPSGGTPTWWFSLELRGGTGIVFDNEFTGTSMYNSQGYPRTYLHDYCNVANDGNCLGFYLTPDRYPGHDQLGRGMNQTLEPLYIWNNTVNGAVSPVSLEDWPVAGAIGQYGSTYSANDIVKKNRDYYEQNASFNGTSGVGVGVLGNGPSTCTPGVGYWATDVRKLFKCSAAGAWLESYSPYTYPHPMRSSQAAVPLAPPLNLRIVQ